MGNPNSWIVLSNWFKKHKPKNKRITKGYLSELMTEIERLRLSVI